MRVLQVINTLDVAGAEMLVFEISHRLARQGVACDVWAMRRSGGSLERRFSEAGVHVFGPESGSIYSPLHALSLRRHLRRHRYDIVHVHLFPAQLWAAIAARMAGARCPLVTTEHSTHNRRRKWYFRHLDRWMYGRYSEVIAISDAAKRALVTWVPSADRKISVVWNGIDIERFRRARGYAKEQLIGCEAPLVISVGRLEPEKGMGDLIAAMADVPGVHLAIAGDGRERQHLERLRETLGLRDRVHLLGRRDDVPELLKTADAYVQPSRWEGFGIAAAEAMATGLPVIASDVPGLAQVVGDAGLLVPPGDPATLAGAIKRVFEDQALRNELSKRAYSGADRFSVERMVEGILNVYERAIAKGR